MNHRTLLKRLLCLVLVVLLAAAAMTLTGCKKNPKPAEADAQATDVGAGEKLIYLTVTFKDESTRSYAVHTDADTVGEALLGLLLVVTLLPRFALRGYLALLYACELWNFALSFHRLCRVAGLRVFPLKKRTRAALPDGPQ